MSQLPPSPPSLRIPFRKINSENICPCCGFIDPEPRKPIFESFENTKCTFNPSTTIFEYKKSVSPFKKISNPKEEE